MKTITSLLWILTGFLYCMEATKKDKNKLEEIVKGIVLMIIGMLGLLSSGRLQLALVVIPVPIGLIYLSLTTVRRIYKCNIPINAIYVGKSKSGGIINNSYSPVFRYIYKEKEYKRESPLTYSKERITEKFIMNEQYQVYIDEKFPGFCVETKNE